MYIKDLIICRPTIEEKIECPQQMTQAYCKRIGSNTVPMKSDQFVSYQPYGLCHVPKWQQIDLQTRRLLSKANTVSPHSTENLEHFTDIIVHTGWAKECAMFKALSFSRIRKIHNRRKIIGYITIWNKLFRITTNKSEILHRPMEVITKTVVSDMTLFPAII